MDRDTAVVRIRRGLSFRGTDKNDEIINALQEAQREFEGAMTLPWFLIEEDASLAVSANIAFTALPTGWIKNVEDEGPHYTNSENEIIFLTKKPFDEAMKFYAEASTQELADGPQAYSIRKTNFYWWPSPPGTARTLTHSYYKAAALLTSNVENVWLANVPDLLIGRAGMIIAHDLRDESAKAQFTDMYKFWRAWLNAKVVEREEESMPRALGRNR